MSALDDRLREAAAAVHQQTESLEIPGDDDDAPVGDDRPHRSRLLVALTAAAAVVIVASVTVVLTRDRDGSANNDGKFSIEALAAKTATQSARMVGTDTLLSKGAQAPLDSFTGIFDFRTHSGRLDLFNRPGPNGRLERSETVLVVDGQVYASVAGSIVGDSPKLPPGKRWFEGIRLTTSPPSPFSGLDPLDPLALFNKKHVKFDDLGMTTLHGDAVHHYHGVLHYHSTTPPSGGSPVDITQDLDLYVDSHGRLARWREIDHQHAGTWTDQVDFSDYGIHVDVKAPPADQVVRASDETPHT